MERTGGLLDQLTAVGALKEGHFLLTSGKHSDRYVEKFDLLRRPRETQEVCAAFAERYRDARLDLVVGPTTGGILLAFETARQLGVGAAYAERREGGGAAREFRRGTVFQPGSRVLVVDDILTTGSSVRETLAALRSQPVEVVAVAVLVDRSGGCLGVGVPMTALASLHISAWDAASCPLCQASVPLTKPGSAQPSP